MIDLKVGSDHRGLKTINALHLLNEMLDDDLESWFEFAV